MTAGSPTQDPAASSLLPLPQVLGGAPFPVGHIFRLCKLKVVGFLSIAMHWIIHVTVNIDVDKWSHVISYRRKLLAYL